MGTGIVAEGAAEVGEQVPISRSKYEARAELEGILPKPVLVVACNLGSRPRLDIIAPKEVEQVRRFQSSGPIGGARVIDQQREVDARFLSEQAGIIHVAKPDGSQSSPSPVELVLVLAQLRDVLAAEDSAVMPQEDNYGRILFPE